MVCVESTPTNTPHVYNERIQRIRTHTIEMAGLWLVPSSSSNPQQQCAVFSDIRHLKRLLDSNKIGQNQLPYSDNHFIETNMDNDDDSNENDNDNDTENDIHNEKEDTMNDDELNLNITDEDDSFDNNDDNIRHSNDNPTNKQNLVVGGGNKFRPIFIPFDDETFRLLFESYDMLPGLNTGFYVWCFGVFFCFFLTVCCGVFFLGQSVILMGVTINGKHNTTHWTQQNKHKFVYFFFFCVFFFGLKTQENKKTDTQVKANTKGINYTIKTHFYCQALTM